MYIKTSNNTNNSPAAAQKLNLSKGEKPTVCVCTLPKRLDSKTCCKRQFSLDFRPRFYLYRQCATADSNPKPDWNFFPSGVHETADCHAAISTHPPYHPIPAAPTSSSFDIPVGKSGPPGLLFCFYQLSTSRVPTSFVLFFSYFYPLALDLWCVVFSYQLPSSFFILVRIVSHFLGNCSDKDSDADHV